MSWHPYLTSAAMMLAFGCAQGTDATSAATDSAVAAPQGDQGLHPDAGVQSSTRTRDGSTDSATPAPTKDAAPDAFIVSPTSGQSDAAADPSDGDASAATATGSGARDAATKDGGAGSARPPRDSGTTTTPPAEPDAGQVGAAGDAGTATGKVTLPPRNAGFDYQLGSIYAPPSGAGIVVRDRSEDPAQGRYNICYVNGFQAQSSDERFWLEEHPELVLRDAQGEPIIDADWDELLLDTSTPEKRRELSTIMAGWIAECARAGFQAVEVDNLDSYSRSGDRLQEEHAVAFMKLLSQLAHQNGLAIAQKNASELVAKRSEMGTDFVVAEECNRYDECDDFRAGYGDDVLVVEYRQSDFAEGCSRYPQLSIVLRDLELVAPNDPDYVYDGC